MILSFVLMAPFAVNGQSFTIKTDTMRATVSGAGTELVYDYIINNTHTPVALKWTVVATDFPSSWLTTGAFGICDNNICYANAGPKWLWNEAFGTGTTFVSNLYGDTTTHGDFHLQLVFASAVAGTHFLTLTLTDSVTAYTRNMTFIINKFPLGLSTPRASSEVTLYPNPATNELNVTYDVASVRNIEVYNIIGKVMNIRKVIGSNSANVNLESIPPGIYFLKAMGGNGEVVTTKKFTKQ